MLTAGRRAGRLRLHGLEKRYGSELALRIHDLEVGRNELLAVLGPSGSGKTTLLRLIAGVERPDRGRILFENEDVTLLGPAERNVAMVFQSYALYPHMTVAQNIEFPLRMRRISRSERERAVHEAATLVRIEHLMNRFPSQLSGGQQQRCALARAIVRKPGYFLLDEPLASLDARLRLEMRSELRMLQQSMGVAAVYVTHDQEEGLAIADRVAILLDGEIAQVGTPSEIIDRPQSLRVATFVGTPVMNLIPAEIGDGTIRIAGSSILPTDAARAPGKIVLGVRPAHIRLGESGIPAEFVSCETNGALRFAVLAVEGAVVRVSFNEGKSLPRGTIVHLSFDPEHLHLFGAADGKRL